MTIQSYLSCSFLPPLKAKTVRIAVITSSATAPAIAYDFNSFVVSTLVNFKQQYQYVQYKIELSSLKYYRLFEIPL